MAAGAHATERGKRKVEESCSPTDSSVGTAARKRRTTRRKERGSGFKMITKLLIAQLRGRHMVK